MRHATPALVLLLAACGGMSPEKFDQQYESKYCVEYESCFEDFDCFEDIPERDNGSCLFNATAAEECLDGEWSCITNQGQAFVQIPAQCGQVYTNCEAGTYTYDGTGTGTGG